ncbi:MAG TPA: hypothetical protein VHS55_09190 [Solirubrobacteraceae bacterium]|jgi:hypothetical protein|nr:hypothetical protein [Solirubrobacteraceae bacterium]
MASDPVFPQAAIGKGMYESFYLRAIAPDQPVGVWIRYTVHKRPGQAPKGSLWCTVFDAERGAPFMHKHTTDQLSVPAAGWIAIGADPPRGAGGSDSGGDAAGGDGASGDGGNGASGAGGRLGPSAAEGVCGPARWSLHIWSAEPELRHLKQPWLYRAPLPRTKLTSPAPAANFDGTIELPDRTLQLRGWRGMVGHNWGAEHAERWIWLHGIDFAEDRAAWLDVALGRVLLAGRLTPWIASGAISLDGRRLRLGGLGARGVRVAESAARCSLSIPGEDGLLVQAHVDDPPGAAAGWRYADPDGGEHDVVNCSVAALSLNVRPRGSAATTLHTAHGAAYELGMREHDHGVPLAPFGDG